MKHSEKKQPEKSEEFKRFEDFTRKLLAVPKKEIDKERAKFERRKVVKTKSR